jgi:hypothetical protein
MPDLVTNLAFVKVMVRTIEKQPIGRSSAMSTSTLTVSLTSISRPASATNAAALALDGNP